MPEVEFAQAESEFISGNLSGAQARAELVLQRSGLNFEWHSRFRVELAKILLYEGESVKVKELLSSELPVGTQLDLVIRRNLLLAIAWARLGDLQLSREAIVRTEALHPAGTALSELQGTQGLLAISQGRLGEAERLLQDAMENDPHQAASFHEAELWQNLGVVALHGDHYEDALDRFHHASVLAQSIGARQQLEKAIANLGWTYYLTGDFSHARQNEETAAKQAEALGATIDEVRWTINAGMSQFAEHDLTAAQASMEKALSLAERIHNAELVLSSHVALSYLLLQQHSSEAELHIREAKRLAAQGEDRSDDLEPMLLEALLLQQQGETVASGGKLLDLAERSESVPSIQWQAENILAKQYATTNQKQSADLWFHRAIATYHRQRASLKSLELQLPFLENGSDLYLDYMEYLIHEGKPEAALQLLDQSRAETLTDGLGVAEAHKNQPPASPQTLAARLHGTILVYCLRPEHSYLWAVTPTRQQLYTLPGSASILPVVARHTQAILASKDLLTQPDSTGRALYDALVRPAEALIPKDARVFLIADKGLNDLNFETLIPPDGQPHYWIEDATITNARSLRLLAARGTKRTAAGHRLLLIGNPVYRADEYASLPKAASEMASVSAHFPATERTVVSGAEATPPSYTPVTAGAANYIHFVAHATADAMTPLDSAIILSHPDAAAPAKLYAADILKQPLTAELVTLSACYGTGTRTYSGEGLVGLVWAFLRAGAHSVIGALWEVSDVSTPQLMDTLYAELLRGNPPDTALRSAKLAMLHGGGVFRKPLYWAPFQLYAGK